MRTIKCAICGKEFQSKQWNAKYCSEVCYKIGSKPILQRSQKEYIKRKAEQRKAERAKVVAYCKICGAPISKDTGRLKYCSDVCAKIGQNLAMERYYAKGANHEGEYERKEHQKRLKKTLADIRKKSTLDKEMQALKQDGAKLGLKSYEYGKYARIKGL